MATTNDDKIFRINHCLCQFSNNGAYLAIAFQTNLIVKDAKTLDTCRSFVFADVIQHIEWSSNSEYILCANITKVVVQVYSIHCPQWKCKLTEGSVGLQSVTWSPDSKCILTVADFNIQISIWNLEDQTVSYIQNVKTSAFDKLHFSPSGKRLAVIITDEAQDTVEIFKTNNWKISRKLICDRLRSIDGIRWSPNDELLCIWCSSTAEPKLIVYSTVWEKPVTTFSPVETARFSEYNCEKELKGIESVEWNSSGQLLAVIGFNEVVILSLHEVHERPICIEIGEKNVYDNFSIAKFKVFEFSACGQYLALTHELYPTTLWIWDICTDYLDYMLLENPISAVRWSPVHPQLLVFSECTRVYEWTRKGASSVAMSKTMSVVDGRWHPEGERVALCGYNKAMICKVPTRF
ncbi:WD repeat-containing protein WRAP73-like isoform X2 [Pseudomyrmex gracilis]|uniref:WD repeat-containing protein WRAP73-like isoform X2 n=1 Tax=Pseudomyrmex gracilis TaxID=219809 RepID=UPI0009957B5B|nr:WD repeat-containing protein WRAP73-like isoform X2 [Pseudomyrmex gracilis]